MSMPRPENISPAQAYIPESSANADADIRDTKKKKGLIVAVIVIIIAAALAVAAFFVLKNPISEKQFQSHMEAGQTYLEEASYEEAVDEFEAAIDIQSDAVEPYRLMAQAYIGLDDSESVEATYDTIRGIIVTHYETSEENELLEDSKALYVDAIDYYGEQEDADTVEELVDEIVPMLTEDEDVEEIEELSEQWIQQIEEDAEDDESADDEIVENSWKQLYEDYISEKVQEKNNSAYPDIVEYEFELAYIDDDDIPELIIDYGSTAYGSEILTVYDNQLSILSGWVGGFSYIERENLFCDSGGHMDEYFDKVYTIQDGQFVLLYSGEYGLEEDIHVEFDPDDYYKYYWQGEEVSYDEYMQNLKEVFDNSVATNGDSWGSAEEILQQLQDL
ncbi:MAG: hypothetical protein LUE14_05715 [Clostridiales bacterium]|nr:hypothetical protein [Clostridiales bacterium]